MPDIFNEMSGYKLFYIMEHMNMLYVKYTFLTVKKIYDEGDCISDNEITIALLIFSNNNAIH